MTLECFHLSDLLIVSASDAPFPSRSRRPAPPLRPRRQRRRGVLSLGERTAWPAGPRACRDCEPRCAGAKTPGTLSGLGTRRSSDWPLRLHAVLHERDVGEGLGEVAHLPLGDRVVLLRQEAEIVSQTHQSFEEGLGVVRASDQRRDSRPTRTSRPRTPLRARRPSTSLASSAR